MISACSRLLWRVCLSSTLWSRDISSRDRKRVSTGRRFLFTARAVLVSRWPRAIAKLMICVRRSSA